MGQRWPRVQSPSQVELLPSRVQHGGVLLRESGQLFQELSEENGGVDTTPPHRRDLGTPREGPQHLTNGKPALSILSRSL